jgi:hypothetical protein
VIDLYDHEVLRIREVQQAVEARAEGGSHDYEAFDREIKERFAKIGFVASVNWYTCKDPNNIEITGMFMPEISIDGRIGADGQLAKPGEFVFDHDRQVHEVTHDLLGLGEEGVIKTEGMSGDHKDALSTHKKH